MDERETEFVAVRREELRGLAGELEGLEGTLTERDMQGLEAYFGRIAERLRALAAAVLLLALGACGEATSGDCPEDWTFAEIEALPYWGAPCPPTVVREEIGCRYRDVCGYEVWVAGCTVDGWLCPLETVRMPAPGAPSVRVTP